MVTARLPDVVADRVANLLDLLHLVKEGLHKGRARGWHTQLHIAAAAAAAATAAQLGQAIVHSCTQARTRRAL